MSQTSSLKSSCGEDNSDGLQSHNVLDSDSVSDSLSSSLTTHKQSQHSYDVDLRESDSEEELMSGISAYDGKHINASGTSLFEEPVDDALSDTLVTADSCLVAEVKCNLSDLKKKPQFHKESTYSQTNQRSHISTKSVSRAVEAAVDSSDDFTQTDIEDYEDGSLHLSQLDISGSSLASLEESRTRKIRKELDRLHQERVEIIELLSLQYLPSSFTVELLEAKLNYCFGQTDMLLASLEDTWALEEAMEPLNKSHHSSRDEEYLSVYRQQFEQSRRDLQKCMEEAHHLKNQTRGRGKTRMRDVIAKKRKTEIEAFKLERCREEARLERTRTFSPVLNSECSSDDPQQSWDQSFQTFAPRFMTPRQHKEHMVELRRSLVTVSGEELHKPNRYSASLRSYSPSPGRSLSPASSYSPFMSRETSRGSSVSPDRECRSLRYSSTVSTMMTSSDINASPSRIPTNVVTSDSLLNSEYRHPRSHSSYLPSRSRSCGPVLPSQGQSSQHICPPIHDYQYKHCEERLSASNRSLTLPILDESGIGYLSESSCLDDIDNLDPEQLLTESHAIRQLNQEQILKAKQALQLLDTQRQHFNSYLRSSSRNRDSLHTDLENRAENEQAIQEEILSLRQQQNQSFNGNTRHNIYSGATSLACQEKSCSSEEQSHSELPSSSNSYAAFARDILARNERHISHITSHSRATTDYIPDTLNYQSDFENVQVPALPAAPSTDSHLFTSRCPSTDLVYLSDSTVPLSSPESGQWRLHHRTFASSRPISSQDIKAKITSRALDKRKEKK